MTSIQIKTILDNLDWSLDDEHIFVSPNIPQKKLLSAINSYAKGVPPAEVLVLLDDTFFGGSREGLLMTNKIMYAKEKESVPKKIIFDEISSIQPDADSSIIVDGEKFFQADFIEHFTVSSFAFRLSSILNCKSVQSQNDLHINGQYSDVSDKQSKTTNTFTEKTISKIYQREFNYNIFKLNLPRFTERLKMMTSNTLDLLRQETIRLIDLQINTLREALPTDKNAPEYIEFKTWISNLENERSKIEKLEMVLAVIGTMKAGKSTTINAIVGMEILPNRETAMTTLPTLIRNIHGQKQPILKIEKIQPLLELSKAIAQKLNGLNDVEKNKIDLQGIEDGKTLITQLIEQHSYPFKTEYSGQDAIFEFLRHLNDIMRLAKDEKIDIAPPYAAYENVNDLPVIEVEFCHLKDNQDVAQGSLAILDTPGPNEFGQSPALREVFRTQLKNASAVLLVTDFTQMKTVADQYVRDQIAEIEDQLPEGSLYVVVNKFDQRNKNSMTKDEVKDYVANSLMAGKVETAQVFPVSSYFAYLANRVKSYLEQHDTLPSYEQEPWLADFAEKAFGTGWEDEDEEENIWDVDHVKDHIKKLERKSFFDEPIEKVIKEAHATAANKSLASAIQKLRSHNDELYTKLDPQLGAITGKIDEVRQTLKNLQEDINSCNAVATKAKEETKKTWKDLEKAMDIVMKAQQDDIAERVESFFREGKKMEEERANKLYQETLKKRAETADLNLRAAFKNILTAGDYEKQRKNRIEQKIQRFNAGSQKVSFDYSSDAQRFTDDISKDVHEIFQDADKQLNAETNNILKNTLALISNEVNTVAGNVLKNAEQTFKDGGFNVTIELADDDRLELSIKDIDASTLFRAAYDEKTTVEKERRRTDSLWGKACKLFGSSDWGWEEYTVRTTTYTVDIEKIKQQVLNQLEAQKKQFSNCTAIYLKDEFQPRIDEYLERLLNRLQRYRGYLDDAIEKSKLDEATKTALEKQLKSVLAKQTILKGDIDTVNTGVKQLQSTTKQAN